MDINILLQFIREHPVIAAIVTFVMGGGIIHLFKKVGIMTDKNIMNNKEKIDGLNIKLDKHILDINKDIDHARHDYDTKFAITNTKIDNTNSKIDTFTQIYYENHRKIMIEMNDISKVVARIDERTRRREDRENGR